MHHRSVLTVDGNEIRQHVPLCWLPVFHIIFVTFIHVVSSFTFIASRVLHVRCSRGTYPFCYRWAFGWLPVWGCCRHYLSPCTRLSANLYARISVGHFPRSGIARSQGSICSASGDTAKSFFKTGCNRVYSQQSRKRSQHHQHH